MIATPQPGPKKPSQSKPEAAPTRRVTSQALDIRYVDHPDFRDPAQVARILESDLPERDESNTTPAPRNLPSYLARLYDTPLLTREQEQIAFLRYNFLKYRAATAAAPDRAARFLETARGTRDLLIRANLRLVVAICRRYLQPGDSDFFELVSEGNLALLRAIESFDIAQGVKFSTYATTAIRRHLFHLRESEQRRHQRFALGLEADAHDHDGRLTNEGNYDPQSYGAEIAVLGLLDRLPPRERWLVTARFGLAAATKERSFTDLGAELGISKERARQIANRALDKLRHWAAASHVELPPSAA